MPSSFVKDQAKQYKISEAEAEGVWDTAVKIASKDLKKGQEPNYGIVTNIFKGMMKSRKSKTKPSSKKK